MSVSPGDTVFLVSDPCLCDDPGCYGKANIAVFTSKQTAEQEADLRSKRYGGHRDRPDMHIDKVQVSSKISGY
ncbi:hypothetical protein [Aeromicrobium sp. 179-A 4D2 NHS]|uniref:hypothetical protein n=1 Tax=Aeromicrobium sp. 179-A 4D2 NHS TaxID=3142375 RepID=UPI0039A15727